MNLIDNKFLIVIYLVKNPSSSTTQVDVSITLNVIKCRYPNCEMPAQPGLELPAVARPSDALFWSNDSDWSFAPEGFGGSSKSLQQFKSSPIHPHDI